MGNLDFNDYDFITASTKTWCAKKIISDYNRFGWEVIKEESDGLFSNLVHLTFRRVHKLENKDQLQYLQVCYEQKINQVFDLERNKNLFSNLLFLLFAIFCVSSFGLCTYQLIQSNLLFGGVCAVLGCVSLFFIFLTARLRKRENRKYQLKVNELNKDIEKMLIDVSMLSGEKNEN
ncbi:MAG: hypothetical protein J6U92_04165 [Clostridia bacterium]|nr:hypothetical protein [Clostridia bacterium]